MNNVSDHYNAWIDRLRAILEIPPIVTIHLAYEDFRDFGEEVISDGACAQLNRFEFEIQVHNDLSTEEELLTIAHEMRHVSQFVDGRLFTSLDGFWWDGIFSQWDDNNIDSPHEIDARIFEAQGFHEALALGLTT